MPNVIMTKVEAFNLISQKAKDSTTAGIARRLQAVELLTRKLCIRYVEQHGGDSSTPAALESGLAALNDD